ncbi:hypothetical protein Tco_0091797 [Tanacetum coccineum]
MGGGGGKSILAEHKEGYIKGTVLREELLVSEEFFHGTNCILLDADHVVVKILRVAHLVVYILWVILTVSCCPKRQKSTAISSMEAEYIALFGCCAHVFGMRSHLTTMYFGFFKMFQMYYDNSNLLFALCCQTTAFNIPRSIALKTSDFTLHQGACNPVIILNASYFKKEDLYSSTGIYFSGLYGLLYDHAKPELTYRGHPHYESYKEYYAIASGKIPPKTKASKKKVDSDATTKQKPPTVPKEKKGKKTGKGKQKAKVLETISKSILTEAEQLKIITKRSLKETHSSYASGSGADQGTGVSPGVPNAPDYDSDDDISWKSSEDDQDKNEDDKNVQDDKDDAKSGDDELKSQDDQDDDDDAQTESEDDGDDFIHPKLTNHDDETTHEEETNEDDTFDPIVHTPSHVSSSDDEDSDNEVEGVDVEGEKSKVQVTQEIKDTHVTLTPVNPDGQQQSSSVSSGFVSNMLNPNQDTSVDAIFGHNAEATSLVNIPVTAIAEPSLFAPTNRPPTPTPLFTQLQQPPILKDQITLDDALVAPANRLKIGKCNLRLSSDVTSTEATLQVIYDVLKLTPFYKAFQVSADVPEIYMQEFWASAYIHNRSVRFKMNNKKHILNLDQFRDILQIFLKVGNEKFEEPPLEKEILAFLASLGHS